MNNLYCISESWIGPFYTMFVGPVQGMTLSGVTRIQLFFYLSSYTTCLQLTN